MCICTPALTCARIGSLQVNTQGEIPSACSGLEWLAKDTVSKAAVVGLVVLLATKMVTAYMNAPGGRPASVASALCSLALDTACFAVGKFM